MNTNRSIRILAIVLLASLLIIKLATGCSFFPGYSQPSGQTDGLPLVKERLDAAELIQSLAAAINSTADIGMAYRSIPDKQRIGVSQDQFQQYIELLRRGAVSRILSFSSMSNEDMTVIRQIMSQQLPAQAALGQVSRGYWLHYKGAGNTDEKLAVYIQADENQQVYLSAEWIQQILSLNDFATLYFDAIDRRDQPALTALLHNTASGATEAQAISRQLLRFYQNQTETTAVDFKLTQARIDGLTFTEYGVLNLDRTQIFSRSIALQVQPDLTIKVSDIIPDQLSANDTRVLLADDPVLAIGSDEDATLVSLYGPRIEKKVGIPFLHDDTNCIPLTENSRLLNLQYNGMALAIIGTCPDHIRWAGTVRTLLLTNDRFRLASGLAVGMSLSDLLDHFPFIIQSGYQVTSTIEDVEIRLTVRLDQDQVDQIRLEILD